MGKVGEIRGRKVGGMRGQEEEGRKEGREEEEGRAAGQGWPLPGRLQAAAGCCRAGAGMQGQEPARSFDSESQLLHSSSLNFFLFSF